MFVVVVVVVVVVVGGGGGGGGVREGRVSDGVEEEEAVGECMEAGK